MHPVILCPIGLTGEDGRRQTLSDLLEELKDVAGERCFDLGCQLNIPKDELNKIQHDKNSFLWKVDMLLIWMQPHTSTNSEVSWNYLARALKCIGMSLSKPASTLIREDLGIIIIIIAIAGNFRWTKISPSPGTFVLQKYSIE